MSIALSANSANCPEMGAPGISTVTVSLPPPPAILVAVPGLFVMLRTVTLSLLMPPVTAIAEPVSAVSIVSALLPLPSFTFTRPTPDSASRAEPPSRPTMVVSVLVAPIVPVRATAEPVRSSVRVSSAPPTTVTLAFGLVAITVLSPPARLTVTGWLVPLIVTMPEPFGALTVSGPLDPLMVKLAPGAFSVTVIDERPSAVIVPTGPVMLVPVTVPVLSVIASTVTGVWVSEVTESAVAGWVRLPITLNGPLNVDKSASIATLNGFNAAAPSTCTSVAWPDPVTNRLPLTGRSNVNLSRFDQSIPNPRASKPKPVSPPGASLPVSIMPVLSLIVRLLVLRGDVLPTSETPPRMVASEPAPTVMASRPAPRLRVATMPAVTAPTVNATGPSPKLTFRTSTPCIVIGAAKFRPVS